MKYGRQRGNWMKLSCGDRVRDKTDERHEGMVESIRSGHEAKVKWENGWISYVPLGRLEKQKQ